MLVEITSKMAQFAAGVVRFGLFFIGSIGVITEIKNYSREPLVWPLIFIFAGVAGLIEVIPKIRRYELQLGALVFCISLAVLAGYLVWERGGWHRLYERVACDLRLDACAQARSSRTSHAFRPLRFTGLNDQFVSSDLDDPQSWCKITVDNADAQVAYFTLTREAGNREGLTVTYRPISISGEWIVVANDPVPFDEVPRVDPSRLAQPSYARVTRVPLTFEPCSTSVAIRICGVPNLTSAARSSERILDTDLEFWNFVSLEDVVVRRRTVCKEPCDARHNISR